MATILQPHQRHLAGERKQGPGQGVDYLIVSLGPERAPAAPLISKTFDDARFSPWTKKIF